jgi:hypothetical protein
MVRRDSSFSGEAEAAGRRERDACRVNQSGVIEARWIGGLVIY